MSDHFMQLRHVMRAALVSLIFIGCTATIEPESFVVADLNSAEAGVVDADVGFGLDVFKALSETEDGNVFMSPTSLSIALGMTLNGATGETRAGMLAAMRLHGFSEGEINESYRTLISMLTRLDPSVTLRIANSIWHRDSFQVEEDFINSARSYFEAEIEGLDFDDPRAPDIVNAWIESATEGMIEKMIDTIDEEMVMYLINAIYFKGDWRYQFDREETRDEQFTTADGESVTVPMMRQHGELPYASREQYTVVDLPYGDSLFSMTIILPEQDEDIDEVIAGLNKESWEGLLEHVTPTRIDLQMPRFELAYEVELNNVLSELGMARAFSRQAEFSGISTTEPLEISEVRQKAVLDVNEEGTEAAAVTVVGIQTRSIPQYPLVKLDRPFVLSIRERHTGTILFIGKIMDPTS